MKFSLWDGNDLQGEWEVTKKIDGVRCHNLHIGHLSRNGKPLYNIPKFTGDIAEIYCGSFKNTIEKTRTSTKELQITLEDIFVLEPEIDPRLFICRLTNPTATEITDIFNSVRLEGLEGLVLKQGNTRLKVKSIETFDVKITNLVEGRGRNTGRLGCFKTEMGNVGTGFTDLEREELFNNDLIGSYIEVECMELTPDGKFRHPRFIRLRPDK